MRPAADRCVCFLVCLVVSQAQAVVIAWTAGNWPAVVVAVALAVACVVLGVREDEPAPIESESRAVSAARPGVA